MKIMFSAMALLAGASTFSSGNTEKESREDLVIGETHSAHEAYLRNSERDLKSWDLHLKKLRHQREEAEGMTTQRLLDDKIARMETSLSKGHSQFKELRTSLDRDWDQERGAYETAIALVRAAALNVAE